MIRIHAEYMHFDIQLNLHISDCVKINLYSLQFYKYVKNISVTNKKRAFPL